MRGIIESIHRPTNYIHAIHKLLTVTKGWCLTFDTTIFDHEQMGG